MNFTVKRLDLTDTALSERQMTYLNDFLEDDNGITDLVGVVTCISSPHPTPHTPSCRTGKSPHLTIRRESAITRDELCQIVGSESKPVVVVGGFVWDEVYIGKYS